MVYYSVDFYKVKFEKYTLGILELDNKTVPSLAPDKSYEVLGFLDDVKPDFFNHIILSRNQIVNGKTIRVYKNYEYKEITNATKKGDRVGFVKSDFENFLTNPIDSLKSKLRNYNTNTDKQLFIIKYKTLPKLFTLVYDSPYMSWNNVGSGTYTYEIAHTDDFTQLYQFGMTSNTSIDVNNLCKNLGAVYHFRVRDSDNEVWSDPITFIIPIDIPILSVGEITLSWDSNANPAFDVYFQLQIITNDKHHTLVVDEILTNVYSYNMSLPSGDYTAKMRNLSDNTGWSETLDFTI